MSWWWEQNIFSLCLSVIHTPHLSYTHILHRLSRVHYKYKKQEHAINDQKKKKKFGIFLEVLVTLIIIKSTGAFIFILATFIAVCHTNSYTTQAWHELLSVDHQMTSVRLPASHWWLTRCSAPTSRTTSGAATASAPSTAWRTTHLSSPPPMFTPVGPWAAGTLPACTRGSPSLRVEVNYISRIFFRLVFRCRF